MAPRKLTDDQLEEIRLMLETFTTGLQTALQTFVTTALQTVLHEKHNQHVAQEDNPQNQQPLHEAQHDTNDRDQQAIQPNRWESSFRSDIPEFQGTLNPEDFIDWLNIVEEILEFRQVPDDIRVSLVATRFKGRAMAWWQQLKESRRQNNKPRIDTWVRLTKHMRRGFLPFNYERTLYNKLQNLRQGTRSVDEYATEFFYLTDRMTSGETERQLISRFIGGLRAQLQVVLTQFNPTSVSEAHQRAISMELQLRSTWNTTSRARFPAASTSDNIGNASSEGTTNRVDPMKTGTNTDTITNSRPARLNALRCFSCGERGHIQTSCPKNTKRGLVIQEIDDDETRYDEDGDDNNDSTDLLQGDM
ncbi:hypothetical protein N665_0059s0022 [Sinapis alba]|nr:hypothetical protein N665_0059s0022 [Sinapis alba]